MLHIDLADQHRRGDSAVHRLEPRAKLLGAVLFILVATLLPAGAWAAYGLLFAATLVVASTAGLGPGYAFRRSYIVLPFALAALTLPFTLPGQPLAQLGPLSISVEGTVRFASIVVKSWLSIQIAILLAATTVFHDLLWAMRRLRLPSALVSIVAFMYRYLFVLGDEALRLRRARAARSAAPAGARQAGGSLGWRARTAGGQVGNLALRAFERSERIHAAMLARGFQGEIRRLDPPGVTDPDRNVLVGWVTYLALVALIGFVF